MRLEHGPSFEFGIFMFVINVGYNLRCQVSRSVFNDAIYLYVVYIKCLISNRFVNQRLVIMYLIGIGEYIGYDNVC